MKQVTFSTILTLFRLVLSPIMLPFLLFYFLPFNVFWINGLLASLFLLFSVTDFLDGYLARRYEQVTALGRILDPIADKFLIFSVIIALLAIGKIFFACALVLIGREIFVLSVRQLALEYQLVIHVSWLAKMKTLAQVVYLTILILNPHHSFVQASITSWISDFFAAPCWMLAETVGMALAVGLAIVSAWQYYNSFVEQYISQAE